MSVLVLFLSKGNLPQKVVINMIELDAEKIKAIQKNFIAIRQQKAMQYLTQAAQKATAIKATVESYFVGSCSAKNKPMLKMSFYYKDGEVKDIDLTEIL